VKDTFFVVCDGLKGLPEVVSNVWPEAIAQTCIIHLIRNTFRLTSRKYWDELKRDLKPIYTAVNATAARAAFDELAAKWGARYPAVVRLWDNAWAEFIPFLDYGACRTIVVDVDLVRVVGAARALAVSEGELSGCPVGLEEVEGDGGEVQFAVCAVQSAA